MAVGVFGLGAPMISNGAPKLVVGWFGESERAKATGIYVTGPVVGQAVALAAANSVIVPATGGSWRSVPLVLAAVTGAVCILWLVLTARIRLLDATTRPGTGAQQANPRQSPSGQAPPPWHATRSCVLCWRWPWPSSS